jgi:hypothetical protein
MSTKQIGIHTLSVVVNFTIVCKLYSKLSHNKLVFVDVMTVVKTAVYKVVINVLCLQKPAQLWQQYQLLHLVSTIFYYCSALILMVTVLLMRNCTLSSSHTIESMNTEHFCFTLVTAMSIQSFLSYSVSMPVSCYITLNLCSALWVRVQIVCFCYKMK